MIGFSAASAWASWGLASVSPSGVVVVALGAPPEAHSVAGSLVGGAVSSLGSPPLGSPPLGFSGFSAFDSWSSLTARVSDSAGRLSPATIWRKFQRLATRRYR